MRGRSVAASWNLCLRENAAEWDRLLDAASRIIAALEEKQRASAPRTRPKLPSAKVSRAGAGGAALAGGNKKLDSGYSYRGNSPSALSPPPLRSGAWTAECR